MIKLDQNLEERKKLENGINNRLGAALLLLNNTIHEQGDIYDLRSDERKVNISVLRRFANFYPVKAVEEVFSRVFRIHSFPTKGGFSSQPYQDMNFLFH